MLILKVLSYCCLTGVYLEDGWLNSQEILFVISWLVLLYIRKMMNFLHIIRIASSRSIKSDRCSYRNNSGRVMRCSPGLRSCSQTPPRPYAPSRSPPETPMVHLLQILIIDLYGYDMYAIDGLRRPGMYYRRTVSMNAHDRMKLPRGACWERVGIMRYFPVCKCFPSPCSYLTFCNISSGE